MLHTAELIQKKRDGLKLSEVEIEALISGISDHTVTDAQIAAFAMAVWFSGMSVDEQSALTLAMRDSGATLSWSGLNGPVLDKHSTGGVGDMVSLILGPLVASCGGYVPMISGRGLGHTGGTLDKLESIPGFNTRMDIPEFQRTVAETGIAIIGQTDDLAPADRRIYAVRDVTATVASIPLIVSSILSKKLAEGLDALVMDIKLGSGAFMQEMEHARLLAMDISRVAVQSGVACTAIITDMNEPISCSAGNAIEIREAIAYLRGDHRHHRMHSVVMALAAELLTLGGLADGSENARKMLQAALDSGSAVDNFARMIAAQGGPADFLGNEDRYLRNPDVVRPIEADRSGIIQAIDLKAVGHAVVRLGGGRVRAEDVVDHSVGVSELCQPGDPVKTGSCLALVHARSEADWEDASRTVRNAIQISEEVTGAAALPIVRERIEGAFHQ